MSSFEGSGKQIDNLRDLLGCLNPSLKKLSIANFNIGSRIKAMFPELVSLTLVNTSTVEFDFGVWRHPLTLTELHISRNHLGQLKNINLLKDFRLTSLRITDAKLANIQELIDALPPSIEDLDLSGNELGQLHAQTFEGVRRLRSLRLDNTNFTFNDFDPFENLHSLFEFDISHNDLSNLNFIWQSKTLKRLSVFRATDCQIKNISGVIHYLGENLTDLYISGNNVGHLSGQTFGIGPNTFQHLNSLNILNIAYNHLSVLDARGLPKYLYYLDIYGNDLTEIKNLNSADFPVLRQISIGKNQFGCLYLTHLTLFNDGGKIDLIGDPWDQKHGENCSHSSNQN